MKRPSFQFYPGDWQANSNLRRCSHTEKGIWVDVMCLLHDQAEYGVLRWPLKEVAQAVGCSVSALKGIVTKGVLKGDDKHLNESFVYVPRHGRKDGDPVTLVPTQAGPIWYSSRMVRDEYVRTIRGESTRFGAADGEAPKPQPKAAPIPPFGDGPSSPSPSPSPSSASQIHSDAYASGGAAPPPAVELPTPSPSPSPASSPAQAASPEKPVLTPQEIIFGYGLPLLTNAGTPEKQARSFLGGLRKRAGGDEAVVNALRDCLKAKPLHPLEWLAAALPPDAVAGKKQPESFREKDARLAAERVAEFAPGLARKTAPMDPANVFDIDAKEVTNVIAIEGC